MDAALVSALFAPTAYPHAVEDVQLVETHISWVFLAGPYAYKVKKPVCLPFVDFSSLAAREFFCREELRLNRRFAAELYLDVVPVAGTPPRFGGKGTPVEWAVRVRRFPQEALADWHAAQGTLQAAHVDALAMAIARFHEGAAHASARFAFGDPELVARPAFANFAEIAELDPPAEMRAALDLLGTWTLAEADRLASRFAERKAAGFVRECHGDLHLGNVIVANDSVTLFDCVEFNAAMRWTDVMSDVAFAYMDLLFHGMGRLAYRFLDRYLERTGDYEGLAVLRFYAVFRALVRAKVALVCHAQARSAEARDDASGTFASYVSLAARLTRREPPVLVLMHGLAGSGKTVASQRLLEALGAVRVRSDVERKRLHGLAPTTHAPAAPGEGLYTSASDDATYVRLEGVAAAVLAAGYPVIVDAAFLERRRREAFQALARAQGAAFELAWCRVPDDVLRGRIERRMLKGDDASDADLAVLARQFTHAESPAEDERVHATVLDTTEPARWHGAVESLARRFRLPLGAS